MTTPDNVWDECHDEVTEVMVFQRRLTGFRTGERWEPQCFQHPGTADILQAHEGGGMKKKPAWYLAVLMVRTCTCRHQTPLTF